MKAPKKGTQKSSKSTTATGRYATLGFSATRRARDGSPSRHRLQTLSLYAGLESCVSISPA